MSTPIAKSEAQICLERSFLELYAEKPLERITAKEVAQNAGYARGSFYRTFNSVEDILTSLEEENTGTTLCANLIANIDSMTLEQITDAVAAFYQDRQERFIVLANGSHGTEYLDAQRPPLKALFAHLLQTSFIFTPLQLDFASEYIASAKVGMVRIWMANTDTISLSQINKMAESIFERNIWTTVAAQLKLPKDERTKTVFGEGPFEYPWLQGSA